MLHRRSLLALLRRRLLMLLRRRGLLALLRRRLLMLLRRRGLLALLRRRLLPGGTFMFGPRSLFLLLLFPLGIQPEGAGQ
jgi:hypothetical protein